MKDSQEAKRERTAEITCILEREQGEPRWKGPSDPLDSLVRTLLSQSTNDNNRDLAYRRLRERFPAWRDVMEADREEVADAIRPAGLGNQKSGRSRKSSVHSTWVSCMRCRRRRLSNVSHRSRASV